MEKEFHNHMRIPWHDYTRKSIGRPITEASLSEKASIIGRTGIMLLSCGTGAWRVRSSMNTLARELGITCTADIGLLSIEYTCIDGGNCYTESLCLFNTGVNTSKLYRMELFVNKFSKNCKKMSGDELHTLLDQIHEIHGFYSPPFLGLAAAVACSAFTFLLGGGPIEMFCAFLGAGAGNFLRAKMNQHHLTLFLCTAASVALACIVYTIAFMALKSGFHISIHHQAGYICSMLFIIPGFPFITSGIDLAKLDMRSGLERLAYALIIIAVATLAAWMLALVLHLKPMDFLPLNLSKSEYLIFRLIASFFGVLGFSVMFNSPLQLAATAGIIGAIANTTRLELVDLASFPPAAAAFLGALLAGLLASMIKTSIGYPRISLTVPSIVIMVPGLYLYRAIYNIGITSINTGAFWFTEALLIIMALPLGLIFARIITDKKTLGFSNETKNDGENKNEQKEKLDVIYHNNALISLQDSTFVLEADRVIFKRGRSVYVNPTSNFISLNKNFGVVQTSFNIPASGPNGMGGVTVEGQISNIKITKDKKGTTYYSMNIMGAGISALVNITLYAGSNKASATISPNFNSNRITLEGSLIPYSQSNIIKGRSF